MISAAPSWCEHVLESCWDVITLLCLSLRFYQITGDNNNELSHGNYAVNVAILEKISHHVEMLTNNFILTSHCLEVSEGCGVNCKIVSLEKLS